MQRHARVLHDHLLLANPWLPAQQQTRAWFASKKQGGSDDKPPKDRGSRFAARLSPEQVERMKTILGAHESEGDVQQGQGSPAPVPSVTISLLQTIKHLNTPDDLKQRLMAYKIMSLNRQLEELHVQGQQLLAGLTQQSQQPAKPAGGLGLMKQMPKL